MCGSTFEDDVINNKGDSSSANFDEDGEVVGMMSKRFIDSSVILTVDMAQVRDWWRSQRYDFELAE